MTKKNGKQDQAGSSRPGPSSSKRRGIIKAWIALALVLGVAIGFFLGRKHLAPPPPPVENATQAAHAEELEHRVSLVEEALHKALKEQQADLASLQVLSTEQRQQGNLPYTFTTLRLPQVDGRALHERLVKELASLVPSAKLTRVSPDVWDIDIDGMPTHRLNLPPEARPEAPAKPLVKGRLAIVIDDLGEDVAAARELTRLGVPVVFSIWPDSSHHEDVLKIAKASGHEVLIHLPMQPKGYPNVDPGPHPLLVGMTADQVKAAVRRAAHRVPGAIGLNNHMGSRFTEYAPGMRAALSAMREDGLFFLDSRTTAGTVCVTEAKRLGLRVYQRDVFLDNEENGAAILKQLRRGETLAKEHGHAIVIGHPHKQTLAAIKEWLKQKDPAVRVVTLSSLPPL